MLFWIPLGLVIGIIVLASLCDYFWKEGLKPPAQRHQVVCRYCARGHSSEEVSGLWFHQFQDRWISCPAHNNPQTEVAKVNDGVTAPIEGAVAWQSDELVSGD